MDLTVSIIGAIVALGGLFLAIKSHFKREKEKIANEQKEYRQGIESRLKEVESETDLDRQRIQMLEKGQEKFESRIEAQLKSLEASILALNNLIIEKFLK